MANGNLTGGDGGWGEDMALPANLTSWREQSYNLLGYSPLASRLGTDHPALYGKWCHRCNGIWFGLALEVQCPRCGNRKG